MHHLEPSVVLKAMSIFIIKRHTKWQVASVYATVRWPIAVVQRPAEYHCFCCWRCSFVDTKWWSIIQCLQSQATSQVLDESLTTIPIPFRLVQLPSDEPSIVPSSEPSLLPLLRVVDFFFYRITEEQKQEWSSRSCFPTNSKKKWRHIVQNRWCNERVHIIFDWSRQGTSSIKPGALTGFGL